ATTRVISSRTPATTSSTTPVTANSTVTASSTRDTANRAGEPGQHTFLVFLGPVGWRARPVRAPFFGPVGQWVNRGAIPPPRAGLWQTWRAWRLRHARYRNAVR